jgi:hypothetical protein
VALRAGSFGTAPAISKAAAKRILGLRRNSAEMPARAVHYFQHQKTPRLQSAIVGATIA